MQKCLVTKTVVCGIILSFVGASFVPSMSGDSEIQKTPSQINELASTSSSTTDWWPMFHHDLNHSGYSTSEALDTNNVLWNYTTGGYVGSSPAVVNGKVYFGSFDTKVYCLNADTGVKIWDYATGGNVYSSPTVADGKVYVGSKDHKVYCLNANTGAWIWDYTTGDLVESSPAVANGKVYVGSDDYKVYCLNASTGAKIWNYTVGSWAQSSPAVANGKVYVGLLFAGKLYCLNADTGGFIWSYTTGDYVRSSPAVVNGKVYFGSFDTKVYCLNADTGVKIWDQMITGGSQSSPAVVNGKVYIGSDYHMICLDANTGGYIWQYLPGAMVTSSPAVASGRVYFGSLDSKVYCLNATTGADIWNYTTGDDVWSSPAVADGKVYIGSNDNKVYCFGEVNQPPNIPSNPSPSNHATGVSINADLSWTGGDPDPGDTVTYDVYLGTENPPPLVVANQSETIYKPNRLLLNTTYFWQIVAIDNHDATAIGPTWDFTTEEGGNQPRFPVDNPFEGRYWIHASGSGAPEYDPHLPGLKKYGHHPSGGVRGADDTYALDLNWGSGPYDDQGMKVYAIESGTIRKIIRLSGWVLIEHNIPLVWRGRTYNIWYSGYLHMRKIPLNLKEDDAVAKSTQIGEVGMMGMAYSPHLHFAIYIGKIVNDKYDFLESVDPGQVGASEYTLYEYGDWESLYGWGYGAVYNHNVDDSIAQDPPKNYFEKGGTESDWFETSSYGFYDHIFYTQSSRSSEQNWGKWHHIIPRDGKYNIYVFIPRRFASTGNANYQIFCNGILKDETPISQLIYSDKWVKLGSIDFKTGDNIEVRLSDKTGEFIRYVAYDAIKIWTKQDIPLPRSS